MYTVYDRMYSNFPAKNAVYTPFIRMYIWFWPTLNILIQRREKSEVCRCGGGIMFPEMCGVASRNCLRQSPVNYTWSFDDSFDDSPVIFNVLATTQVTKRVAQSSPCALHEIAASTIKKLACSTICKHPNPIKKLDHACTHTRSHTFKLIRAC
jgi:hypothetical protein